MASVWNQSSILSENLRLSDRGVGIVMVYSNPSGVVYTILCFFMYRLYTFLCFFVYTMYTILQIIVYRRRDARKAAVYSRPAAFSVA